MNKKRKIIIYILITVFSLFIPWEKAEANDHRLMELDIFVYIDEDGSAFIKEKRICNLTQGTENYIVIGSLGKSDISDFMVTENGKEYHQLISWNIDGSREDKAYKSGIIETRDGYELCWGIGEYGYHEYEVQYRVSNFIKETKDKQMIFWRFVNDKTNIPPEKVSLTIDGYKKFDSDNSKIWAFGYEGQIIFDQDQILAYSEKAFTMDNYLTVLVELEQGMYRTEDRINKTFKQIQEKAFKGSDYGADTEGKSFLAGIFTFIAFGIIFYAFIMWILRLTGVKGEYHRNRERKFKKTIF